MRIREATISDADFLTAMLVEAGNWSGERFTRRQVLTNPDLLRYVADWPRMHDFGVVAVGDGDGDGDGEQPIGAAWARVFTAADPGYGFVAADVPEISMAVVPERRRSGIGRRLLAALIDQARSEGWRRLSLSVEDGNAAVELYRAFGFGVTGRNDNSDTMTLEIDDPHTERRAV